MASWQSDDHKVGIPLDGVWQAFQKRSSPHAHEYTRLHLLVGIAFYLIPNDVILKAGERLLKFNPKDFRIKYYVLGRLDSSTPGGFKKVLKYADEIAEENPNEIGAMWVAGRFYYDAWRSRHDKIYLEKSRKCFQRYLSIKETHPNEFWRKGAKGYLDAIEQALKQAKPVVKKK